MKVWRNIEILVSLVWNKILFYCYISTYLGSLKLFLINDTEFMVPLEAASFVLAIEIRNGGGLRQDSFHFVLSLNGWVQPPKQPRAQRKECNCVFLFSPSEMWCTILQPSSWASSRIKEDMEVSGIYVSVKGSFFLKKFMKI